MKTVLIVNISGNIRHEDTVADLIILFSEHGWNVDIVGDMPYVDTSWFSMIGYVRHLKEVADCYFWKRGLYGYDVILMLAHGQIQRNRTWFISNESVRPEYQIRKNHNIHMKLCGNYAYSDKWIEKYYKDGDFKNAVIYLCSCHGLEKSEHFGRVFRKKGAKAVIGWDNTVRLSLWIGEKMFRDMIENGSSLAKAYKKLKHTEERYDRTGAILSDLTTESEAKLYSKEDLDGTESTVQANLKIIARCARNVYL